MRRGIGPAVATALTATACATAPAQRAVARREAPEVNCAEFPGRDAADRIRACISALQPGEIADARRLGGAQRFGSDPFDTVVRPTTVRLGRGTYTFFTRMSLHSGLHVRGDAPDATTLIEAPGSNLEVALGPSFDNLTPLQDIGLSEFTLDLNRAMNSGDCQRAAVNLGRAQGTRVSRLVIRNYAGLRGCGSAGRGHTGVTLFVRDGLGVTLEQNRIERVGEPPAGTSADHQADGIYASGRELVIRGNTIVAATDTAIVAENARDAMIYANTIDDSVQGIAVSAPTRGMRSQHVLVFGNEIRSITHPNGQGVLLWGAPDEADRSSVGDVEVFGNRIVDTRAGAGIVARHVDRARIRGNWIAKISRSDARGSGRDGTGILVDEASAEVDITGNVIEDTGQRGIWVQDSTRVRIVGNEVSRASAHGVALQGVRSFEVRGNRVRDASQARPGLYSGIIVDRSPGGGPDSDAGAIVGNESTGATQGRGIAVFSGTLIEITGNNVESNRQTPGLWVAPTVSQKPAFPDEAR